MTPTEVRLQEIKQLLADTGVTFSPDTVRFLLTLVEQYREGLKEIAAGKFNAWDARDFAERLLRGEEQ